MQEPRGAIAIDASPLAVGGVPASWSRRRHDRWSARASVMLPSAAPTGDTVTVDRIDSQERVAQAAIDGDRAAMERLLSLWQPDIRRYAQRHCLISDIDDAVQETLWTLSRRLPSVKKLAALSSWLFKTVQRQCRRLSRKAFAFDPFDEERLEHWLAAHSSDELRLELVNALESLPADYRQVILLRDFEQLTIGEIAAQLGLSSAATKSRLRRARLLAREYLMGDEQPAAGAAHG